MRDGLYKISFQTQMGTGSGVIVLNAGRVTGGDNAAYYVGTYFMTGDRFTVDVEVHHHTSAPGLRLLFAAESFRLKLEGDGVGDEAIMSGSSPDAPDVQFSAVLQRLAE